MAPAPDHSVLPGIVYGIFLALVLSGGRVRGIEFAARRRRNRRMEFSSRG